MIEEMQRGGHGEGMPVFIDAIVVKVRDGQVRNWPFYVAVGVPDGNTIRHPRDHWAAATARAAVPGWACSPT